MAKKKQGFLGITRKNYLAQTPKPFRRISYITKIKLFKEFVEDKLWANRGK